MASTLAALMSRLHPEDKEPTEAAFEQPPRAGGRPFDIEMRLQHESRATTAGSVRAASRCAMPTGSAVRMAGVDHRHDRPPAGGLPSCSPRRNARRSRWHPLPTASSRPTPTAGSNTSTRSPKQLTGWTDRHGARPADAGDLPHDRRDHAQGRAESRSRWCCARSATSKWRRPCCCCATTAPKFRSCSPPRRSARAAAKITGVVLVLHDVSRERQYAAKLSYQASHDSLTGLINRARIRARLTLALKSAAQLGRHHAVMYLDLDQFKVVNDTCGHAAGDQLMRQVSAVLQRRLREGDTLARLGGDEFGVLLENCAPDNALRIADELRQTVMDFHFAWESRSLHHRREHRAWSTSRTACSRSPMCSARPTPPATWPRKRAATASRSTIAEDSELSMRHGEMEWVGRLQKALDEDRFVLYAQDIVGLIRRAHKRGSHCELLVRMLDEKRRAGPADGLHPGGGALRPDAFDRPLGDSQRLGHHRPRNRPRWPTATRTICLRSTCPAPRSATSASSSSCASSSTTSRCPHAEHLLRDHRDGRDRQPRQGDAFHPRAARRSAAGSRWTTSAPACRRLPI